MREIREGERERGFEKSEQKANCNVPAVVQHRAGKKHRRRRSLGRLQKSHYRAQFLGGERNWIPAAKAKGHSDGRESNGRMKRMFFHRGAGLSQDSGVSSRFCTLGNRVCSLIFA